MIYKVPKLASRESICFKATCYRKLLFFAIEFGFIPDCQRWENPCRNPCTASVYPTLEGLSASGGPRPSMCFPHTTSSRVPARMITLVRLFLKTTLGQSGFPCPKFQHFSPFREKCLLDNTTVIYYLAIHIHNEKGEKHYVYSA